MLKIEEKIWKHFINLQQLTFNRIFWNEVFFFFRSSQSIGGYKKADIKYVFLGEENVVDMTKISHLMTGADSVRAVLDMSGQAGPALGGAGVEPVH